MFKEVLEILGENGEHWGRGAFVFQKRYCLLGAAMESNEVNIYAYKLALQNQIIHLFPERNNGWLVGSVTVFNDHPDTTFEDVKLVLEKAKAEAGEI